MLFTWVSTVRWLRQRSSPTDCPIGLQTCRRGFALPLGQLAQGNIGPLILQQLGDQIRITVGGILAAHGLQKLFGWFGGHGIHGAAGFLGSLGFRPGRAYAGLLGGAELLGGLALALGLLTPLASAAVVGVMLAAIAVVHWDKGFFVQSGGYEFPLALAMAAIALAFSGSGGCSVDHALAWSLGGPEWGITAAFLAVLASSIVTAARGLRVHRSAGFRATSASGPTRARLHPDRHLRGDLYRGDRGPEPVR